MSLHENDGPRSCAHRARKSCFLCRHSLKESLRDDGGPIPPHISALLLVWACIMIGIGLTPVLFPRSRAAAVDPSSPFLPQLGEIAIGINTVLAEGRWKRNYERIFKRWSRNGELQKQGLRVFWFSDGEANKEGDKEGDKEGEGAYPWIRKIPVEQWQERWVTMLQHLYEAATTTTDTNSNNTPTTKVKWFLMIDDDTYLFFENLLSSVLGKYDAENEALYIGNTSEDLTIAEGLTKMGMGGGGVALSFPLVKALAEKKDTNPHSLVNCLKKTLKEDFGGDKKLALCVANVGGRFIRERGFHQLDVKGDYTPLLWYLIGGGSSQDGAGTTTNSPLVSLHHMYSPAAPVFRAAVYQDEGKTKKKKKMKKAEKKAIDDERKDFEAAMVSIFKKKEKAVGAFQISNRAALDGMDKLFSSYLSHHKSRSGASASSASSSCGASNFLLHTYAHASSSSSSSSSIKQPWKTIEGNVGLSLRLWPDTTKPTSHFTKLLPLTTDAWEPSQRVGKVGQDWDARKADDPCEYFTLEWEQEEGSGAEDHDNDDEDADSASNLAADILPPPLQQSGTWERLRGSVSATLGFSSSAASSSSSSLSTSSTGGIKGEGLLRQAIVDSLSISASVDGPLPVCGAAFFSLIPQTLQGCPAEAIDKKKVAAASIPKRALVLYLSSSSADGYCRNTRGLKVGEKEDARASMKVLPSEVVPFVNEQLRKRKRKAATAGEGEVELGEEEEVGAVFLMEACRGRFYLRASYPEVPSEEMKTPVGHK